MTGRDKVEEGMVGEDVQGRLLLVIELITVELMNY
jgi:hypothetical protein